MDLDSDLDIGDVFKRRARKTAKKYRGAKFPGYIDPMETNAPTAQNIYNKQMGDVYKGLGDQVYERSMRAALFEEKDWER